MVGSLHMYICTYIGHGHRSTEVGTYICTSNSMYIVAL